MNNNLLTGIKQIMRIDKDTPPDIGGRHPKHADDDDESIPELFDPNNSEYFIPNLEGIASDDESEDSKPRLVHDSETPAWEVEHQASFGCGVDGMITMAAGERGGGAAQGAGDGGGAGGEEQPPTNDQEDNSRMRTERDDDDDDMQVSDGQNDRENDEEENGTGGEPGGMDVVNEEEEGGTPVNFSTLYEGKWRLVEKTDGDGCKYLEAVRDDENGELLFSETNMKTIMAVAYNQIEESGFKWLPARDENGHVKSYSLTKTKRGKRLKHLIHRIHYLKDAEGRNPPGHRWTLLRTTMYRFSKSFSKDRYSTEISNALQKLSQSIRIKVGDDWVCTPERAFGIKGDTKGKYDGDLEMNYYKDGILQGSQKCLDPLNRLNNNMGFHVPDWYPEFDQKIEKIKVEVGEQEYVYDEVRLKSNAWCVLVCEDSGLFNLLRQVQFWNMFPVILVLAKGKPDHETVAFVSMLCNTLKIDA